MKNQQIIKAIMSTKLKDLLCQTGQYDDFVNGDIKCQCCGSVITADNISTLVPYVEDDVIKLKFYCNNFDCVNSKK